MRYLCKTPHSLAETGHIISAALQTAQLVFIARQHAQHEERDIVLLFRPSVPPSV